MACLAKNSNGSGEGGKNVVHKYLSRALGGERLKEVDQLILLQSILDIPSICLLTPDCLSRYIVDRVDIVCKDPSILREYYLYLCG